MKNLCILALMVSALTGCAGIINPYGRFSPEVAATKIVEARAPEALINSNANLGGVDAMILDRATLDLVVSDLRLYCVRNTGTIIPFKNPMQGFACYSSQLGTETFAARTGSNFMVMEKRPNEAKSFDLITGLWEYVSVDEARKNQQKARQEALVKQELAAAEQLEMRKRDSYKVKKVGVQVCKDVDTIRYVGTVEQVAGDRVKVFAERAYLINAPTLSPGNFRQSYGWVNAWDVYACN